MIRLLAERYELADQLGGGGTALVYRARDRQTDSQVAIKLLRPDFAAQRAVCQRFLREGELMRQLDDPAIVRVLDVGRDADLPFLVMELVQGTTLRRELETRGPMSVTAAAAIILPVTRALDQAHAAGIVHRDVKPENIFVDGWNVKLGDFGNARVVSLASVTGASLTWGTPEYVAPALFARGRADPRSDYYAVGVVLYEMLTGRRPWSRAEALSRIGASERAARALAPTGAGERIDRLLADLLATAPGDRPASGQEIRARLTGDADADPVSRTSCLACGARRPEDVPVCFECGHELLKLPADIGGPWRVVLERLDDDLASIDKLLRLLGPLAEPSPRPLLFLTGSQQLYSKDELKRGIDFPAVLFADLSEEAARTIAGLFRDHGFDVRPVRMRARSWLFSANSTRGAQWPAVFAAASVGMMVHVWTHDLLASAGAATAGLAGAAGLIFRNRRVRAERIPASFQLRRQLAPVPAADGVLSQARAALGRIRVPEVRALLTDVATEIYRLSRRSAREPTLTTAGALLARLGTMAERLDTLDDALAGSSEGEIMNALARADRAGSMGGGDGAALDTTRRDLEAALQRRQGAEGDRARLAAKMCELLGRLRSTVRAAGRLDAEPEADARVVDAATTEVEALLSSMPAG